MGRRGKARTTAPHILAFLEENKGTGKRFGEIYHAMQGQGYHHNSTSISNNLTWLVQQKKIVKIFCYYGVPTERKDGSRYLIVKGQGVPNDTVELE